jgi:hypothetical protein
MLMSINKNRVARLAWAIRVSQASQGDRLRDHTRRLIVSHDDTQGRGRHRQVILGYQRYTSLLSPCKPWSLLGHHHIYLHGLLLGIIAWPSAR